MTFTSPFDNRLTGRRSGALYVAITTKVMLNRTTLPLLAANLQKQAGNYLQKL
jgi:hypothetical protein